MAKFTLTNGKIIVKPFNKIWLVLGALIALVILFSYFIPLDLVNFKPDQLPIVLKKMFTPQRNRTWADYFEFIFSLQDLLVLTLQMCYGGTVLGSLLAIPLALLSSKNIVKTKFVYGPARFILNLFRTIPVTILAVLSISMVGSGVLAGIFAMMFFTFGIMAKMLYEVIETIDMNCYEALESTGANKLQSVRFAVLPQVFPVFIGYVMYIFEINVRSSAILSYVGVASLGNVIRENELIGYDRIGGAIIVIFVTSLIVQFLSSAIRRKLQ